MNLQIGYYSNDFEVLEFVWNQKVICVRIHLFF